MIELIKENNQFFKDSIKENISKNLTKNIVEIINKDKIVIITGLKGIGKTGIISKIIQNSSFKDNFLYIDKKADLENILKSEISLKNYLDTYIMYYSNPKVIILKNLSQIEGIRDFINFLYKQNYKIIIISNIIKIGNIKEIEILEEKKLEYKTHHSSLISKEIEYEEKYQRLKTKDIIFEEIIKNYSLKNFDLYYQTIIFISKINDYYSIREINRKLNNEIKISLVTMMEYIKYSIDSKIIEQVQVFDFKKNKTIETKTKYYFSDTNFRNSLYNFSLQDSTLRENLLHNELIKAGYKVHGGNNGSYDFSFYCPLSISPQGREVAADLGNKKEISTLFIDFCYHKDKKEIKKQINKLLKVPQLPQFSESGPTLSQTFSKYLILENTNNIGIKKLQYENLKIVSLNELLQIIHTQK